MRRIENLTLLLVTGPLAFSCAACSGIQWEYDFAAAESKAKLEQKDLFVYYRQWYSPQCSRLEGDWLLTAPEVTATLKETVNCWLEWDWSQEIARKHQVRSYPAFVFVRPNSKVSIRTGAISLEQFLRFAERSKTPPPPAP